MPGAMKPLETTCSFKSHSFSKAFQLIVGFSAIVNLNELICKELQRASKSHQVLQTSSKVKLASCKYLDGLPTSGNKLGRAFRDVEWEDQSGINKNHIFKCYCTVPLCESLCDTAPCFGDRSGPSGEDPHLVPGHSQAVQWHVLSIRSLKELGIGAQFGGKWALSDFLTTPTSLQAYRSACKAARYFLHDVRVVRLPRHGALAQALRARMVQKNLWFVQFLTIWGASCPVGIGVSCSADRQAKARAKALSIWKLPHAAKCCRQRSPRKVFSSKSWRQIQQSIVLNGGT